METLTIIALSVELLAVVIGAVWIVAGIKSTTRVFEASLGTLSHSVVILATKVEKLDDSLDTSKSDIAVLAEKLDNLSADLKTHLAREGDCTERVNKLSTIITKIQTRVEDHIDVS